MTSMLEEKGIAERIKKDSIERTHRLVIDEKLPDGNFRILISRVRTGVSDGQGHDSSSWEEEEERYVGSKQLTELLPGKRVSKFTEGQVFEIRQGQSADVYPDERKRIKTKTAKLLIREGKTMSGTPEERR